MNAQSKPFSADAAEFIPTWERITPGSIKGRSHADLVLLALSRALKVTAAEFVPTAFCQSEDIEDKAACKIGCSPSSKLSHKFHTSTDTILSTTEGSAEECSSASSVTSASRSTSPSPSNTSMPAKEEVVQTMSVSALLKWRHSAPTKIEEEVPFAAVPEAGSSEAAVAEAVYKMATEAQSTTESSNSTSMKQSTNETPQSASKLSASMSLRPGQKGLSGLLSAVPRRQPSELSAPKPVQQEEKAWRSVEPVKKLEVSADSWTARQRARRSSKETGDVASDEEVIRAMKGILNKLTLERFDSLAGQLLDCGIRTATHLEQLIHEIFEKATTQHHFIDMYADLCVLLNDHGVINDPTVKMKKILLSSCQASFEKHLEPPAGLDKLSNDDREIAENLYKTRMLGNIRFVGALLTRKMLASKVLISICEELLQDPTAEALESLAALLIVVGPAFDHPNFAHHMMLIAIFKQVEKLSKKSSVPKRARCLLKDVTDVRSAGWNDRRPKKIEGPLKLDQVAAKAAFENGEKPSSSPTNAADDWAVVSGARPNRFSTPSVPVVPVLASSSKFDKANKKLEKLESSRKSSKQEAKGSPKFDKDACRKEVAATFAELRVSHDVTDAAARIGDISVPPAMQSSEFVDILARLAEEGSSEVRKIGFTCAAGLILQKYWKPEAAKQGLQKFVEEAAEDLKCDVPNLSKIVKDEMHPAFASLVKEEFVDAALYNSLLSI